MDVMLLFLYNSILNLLGCAALLLSLPDFIWNTPQPPGCPINLFVSFSLNVNASVYLGNVTGLFGKLCAEHATPTAQRIKRWMCRLLAVWIAVLLQRTTAYLLRPVEVPHIANVTATNVTNASHTAPATDSAGVALPWNNFILSIYVIVPIIFLWECTVAEFFAQRPGPDNGCAFCRSSPGTLRFCTVAKIFSVVFQLYTLVHLLTVT
ncbi:uncharacterized protein LOC129588777 [Paramacrobiotus metropolitanus]|uniref:uncharacterized protein LOC129588777 n=1 Tax=Paramacrobiotus metropolitanus TaxID=2943436 RepID=UPI002445B3BC|nr:uncharacterized protein LOC129588777 [Paramacrobiotus metropolitanus]